MIECDAGSRPGTLNPSVKLEAIAALNKRDLLNGIGNLYLIDITLLSGAVITWDYFWDKESRDFQYEQLMEDL